MISADDKMALICARVAVMPSHEALCNIHAYLEEAVVLHGDRTFLFDQGCTLTYRQVWHQSNTIAAWMTNQDIAAGSRILILGENRADIPIIAFAAARAGIVFSILSPQLKPEGLMRIVQQCEPNFIFIDQVHAVLRDLVPNVPAVWLGGPPTNIAGKDCDYDELLAGDWGEPPAVSEGGDRLAFLVFTSGSTGVPRGVMLSHANVRFVSHAIQARLGYVAEDRIALLLPLAFDYGLYQLFYAAMCGASIFVGRPEMAGPELCRVLAKQGITVLPGVPTLFAALIKLQRYRPIALPALRILTNTGDHLPQAYIQQLTTLFPAARLFPMYGLTECKRVSILLPAELPAHQDSVGRPLDGTEVWAEDSEGQRLPPGACGQWVVRGPHVALGYWQASEETAQRFRIGGDGSRTLLTGDYGAVDAEGFLHFHARSDFLIKHRGHRLSPVEVEEAACQSDLVVAAGCIKDEERNLLCLFLSSSTESPDASAMLADLATRIELAKLPDKLIFIDELPLTANRKVDRKALRALLSSHI